MSAPRQAAKPLLLCVQCSFRQRTAAAQSSIRAFSSTSSALGSPPTDVQKSDPSIPPPPPTLDPNLVATKRDERRLIKTGVMPIGSRRRRAVLSSTDNIPFEQLPYQCFQEARKVLQEDREEKLREIDVQRARLQRIIQAAGPEGQKNSQVQLRIKSHEKRIWELKILADINDPMVKKRFEDGEGDMNRPIYRYLADRQWRTLKRKVLMQRITQMTVVPDVLMNIDPVYDVDLSFVGKKVQPGEFVHSLISESPARLKIQPFDKGERLVTIAVVDSDVPNVEKDGFDFRCHFLASNIKVSPTDTAVQFSNLSSDNQTILPWLPPFAQKGSPYHRLSIFVFNQPKGEINVPPLKEQVTRDGFNLRSFMDRKHLKPVGVQLFRTQWDEGTDEVMSRNNIEGGDVEYKRKRVEPLPYKKKDGARFR